MPLKIAGRTIEGSKTALLVFPRDGYDIAFKFVGIGDDSDYIKINPVPQPPRIYKVALGQTIEDVENKEYKEKLQLWGNTKTDWLILKSLEPSQIEWVKVNMSDPTTFHLWREDLLDAGFTLGEVQRVMQEFFDLFILSDEKLKEARDRFLALEKANQLVT